MDDTFDKLINEGNVNKFKLLKEGAANGSKQPEAGTSKEKPFTPKKWVNKESSTDVFDIDTIFQEAEQSSKEIKKCRLFPPPETPFCPLHRIFQTPKCPLPIPTNEKFKHLSVDLRSRLLSDYFTSIAKLQMQRYRKSLFRAPQPKEFALKVINSTTLASASKHEAEEKESVYFTRSGRPLKRKNYTENENYEPDEEAILKKNKIDTDTDDKLTFDDFDFEDKPVKLESPQSKTPKTAKKPPNKRLFSKGTSRAAKILDNAKVEMEKQSALDEDMAEFERSLCNDDIVMDTEAAQTDEDFKPVRVTPPVPRGRRPLRTAKPKLTKANSYTELPITVSQKSSTRSQNNSTTKTKTKSVSPSINSDNTKSIATMEQVSCPICNKLFNEDRIQDHAATCGLDEVEEVQPHPGPSPLKKTTCELCNREFLLSRQYEAHVKECIAAKITDF